MPNILNTVYKIGGVDTSKPLPVGVTVSFDAGAKKTFLACAVGIGVGIGIGIGIVNAFSKKTK